MVAARLRRVRRQQDTGASAVEFALVVPLLLLIVFGLINFGVLFSQQLTINQAVREGARRGVVYGATLDNGTPARSCNGILASVQNQVSGLAISGSDIAVKITTDGFTSTSGCGTGFHTGAWSTNTPCLGSYNSASRNSGSLVVEAQYVSNIPISFPPFPTTMTLSSKAVFRCEFTS